MGCFGKAAKTVISVVVLSAFISTGAAAPMSGAQAVVDGRSALSPRSSFKTFIQKIRSGKNAFPDDNLTQKTLYLELVLKLAASMLKRGESRQAIRDAVREMTGRAELEPLKKDFYVDPDPLLRDLSGGRKAACFSANIYGENLLLWVYDPESVPSGFLAGIGVPHEYRRRGFWAQADPRSVVPVERQREETPRRLDFARQVAYISAVKAFGGVPIYRVFRSYLVRSGFVCQRVVEDLIRLEKAEEKEIVPDEALEKRMAFAKASLKKLITSLPQSLRQKGAWEKVDPADYDASQRGQGVDGMVGEALDELGWRFTIVDGRARITLKTEAGAAPAKMPAALASAAVSAPEWEREQEQPAGGEIVLTEAKPAAPRAAAAGAKADRKDELVKRIKALLDDYRCEEAARLLVIGIRDPGRRAEAIRILREDIDPAFSAVILSSMPAETAAYILSSAVAVREKPVIFRDIRELWRAQADFEGEAVPWACEVLMLADCPVESGASTYDTFASRIITKMAAHKVIKFGDKVAEKIIVHCLGLKGSDPDVYAAGLRLYGSLSELFRQEKIIEEESGVVRNHRLFTGAVPEAKKIGGEIPLATDGEITDNVAALIRKGLRRVKESGVSRQEIVDRRALEQAAIILFVKLDPAKAFRVIREMTGEEGEAVRQEGDAGMISDTDLEHLLPLVPPRFAAGFFVELNASAKRGEKEYYFQWTMNRMADLLRGNAAGPAGGGASTGIVRAMLMDEFAAEGGRELFRRIIDPKNNHDYHGDAMELYHALYREIPEMTDPEVFTATGKVFSRELSGAQRDARALELEAELSRRTLVDFSRAGCEETLKKISRLGTKRAAEILLGAVNRNYQCVDPEIWGMTQEEFDDLNALFLRTARDIDPQGFVFAYWRYRGEMPDLVSRVFNRLRRLFPKMAFSPIWSRREIDRAVAAGFTPTEQAALVLSGIQMGEDDRVAEFVKDALGERPGSLDPLVIAAAGFMKSRDRLKELYPFIKVQYQGAAGLYRSRSVLKSFDGSWAGPTARKDTHPFQGEFAEIEIFLGRDKYNGLLEQMSVIFPELRVWGEEQFKNYCSRSITDNDVFACIQSYYNLNASNLNNILGDNTISAEKKGALVQEYLAPLKQNRKLERLFPLLSDYVASAGLRRADDLREIINLVWNAVHDRVPEKLTLVKDLAITHEELSGSLKEPFVFFPESWRRELSFLKAGDMKEQGAGMTAVDRFPLRTASPAFFITGGLALTGAVLAAWPYILPYLNALLYKALVLFVDVGAWIVGKVLVPLFQLIGAVTHPAIALLLAMLSAGALLAGIVWISPAVISIVLFGGLFICVAAAARLIFNFIVPAQQLLFGLLCRLSLPFVLPLRALKHYLIDMPLTRLRLSGNIRMMLKLLSEAEFDPAQPLESQIPAPLLAGISGDVRLTIEAAYSGDLDILDALVSKYEMSSDPYARVLLNYARERRHLLMPALESPGQPTKDWLNEYLRAQAELTAAG